MSNKNRFIIILIVVFVILPFILSLFNFYTDWLFFKETGFTQLFTTALSAKVGAGLFFGAVMLTFTMINLLLANGAKFPQTNIFVDGGTIYRLKRDEAARLVRP